MSRGTRTYRLGSRAISMRETRRQILSAAAHMFQRLGYHDVSIEDLAEKAGVSRATVYKHFASKAALLRALEEEFVARGEIHRVRDARMHPDALRALEGFLLENCRLFARLRPGLRISRAAAWTDADARRVAAETYYGQRRQAISELVQRLDREHGLARGWAGSRVVDALMALTGFETFETLTDVQGLSTEQAAKMLFDLAQGMLAANRRRPSRRARSRS